MTIDHDHVEIQKGMALALILTLSFVLVGEAAGEDDLEPDPERDLCVEKSMRIYKDKISSIFQINRTMPNKDKLVLLDSLIPQLCLPKLALIT